MDQLIQVDNASYSFGFQIDNGIPIIPFYNSKEDTELKTLATYLKKMANEQDIRVQNKKHFKFRTIVESTSVADAYEQVIAKS